MTKDFVSAEKTFHTENSMLRCGIKKSGVFAMEYFSFADVYCSYYVNLDADDIKTIENFLTNWGSEKVRIIQPYSSTVNDQPTFCALDLEYVEIPNAPRESQQRITFYCECWGKDVEDSLKEDKITAWSSWDDFYNWDEFETFRAYVHALNSFFENSKEVSE